MKSKSKLFIAIAAFVIAIVAAVGITYGVMAAQNATVNTSVNVGYTSHEVAATLSATYQVDGSTATDFKTSDGSTKIVFDGTEAEDGSANVKTFVAPDPENTTLTSAHKTITFVFTIKNDGDGTITGTITLPATQTNVTVTKTGNSNTIEVEGGATATYTVTVTVTNVAKNAAFSGDFSWSLTKKIEV